MITIGKPRETNGHIKKTSLALPPRDTNEVKTYYCASCDKGYKKLKGNFRASQSPLFRGWGHIPICIKCLDHYEKEYTERLGSNDEAIRRLALHFDLYLDESLLAASKKIAGRSRIAGYIAKANLIQYKGRTYDTYLEEMAEQERVIESVEDLQNIEQEISEKTLMFWGAGFSASDYIFLNNKYDDWTNRHECKTQAQESLFQKLCMIELQMLKGTQKGEKIDGYIKSFNDTLGVLNIKPVQNIYY